MQQPTTMQQSTRKTKPSVCAKSIHGLEVSLRSRGTVILSNFCLTARILASFAEPGQLDVKREILKTLLGLVPVPTRQELMLYSEARKLWHAPAKLDLNKEELLRDFCNEVPKFQIVMSVNHPRIKFGNLSALRLSLSSAESLLPELARALSFLSILDLGVEDCVETQDFMGNVVKILAPSLQGLSILRVHYDASAILLDHQEVSYLQLNQPISDRIILAGRGLK